MRGKAGGGAVNIGGGAARDAGDQLWLGKDEKRTELKESGTEIWLEFTRSGDAEVILTLLP